MWEILLSVMLGGIFLLFWRIWTVLPRSKRKQVTATNQSHSKRRTVLILLGSGGHTAEMIRLLEGMDLRNYYPRLYVLAISDIGVNGSEAKALSFENKLAQKLGNQKPSYSFHRIPRSREVHQSWTSTIITTFYSFFIVYLLH